MNIVIPMAGRGSRLRPHTLTVPKPLVPVGGKPIVERLAEDIVAMSAEPVEEIAFIIGDFGAEVEAQLLAVAERVDQAGEGATTSQPLAVRVQPTLVPSDHPLAGVNGVNNAILVEGDPIGQVMFYGPGAGAGPTASAVVADILNIAGIRQLNDSDGNLDPLLAASSWRACHLVNSDRIHQRNYVRFTTDDTPGVIGRIGSCFGEQGVSIQSIVQFDASDAGAEIVVITHEVDNGSMRTALNAITALPDVRGLAAHLGCL